MKNNEPYYHTRFRWWTRVELDKVSEDLKNEYDTVMKPRIADEHELGFQKDDRSELEVKSDTLTAFLSPFRVILFQKKKAPFTSRDMELRNKVIELYPREKAIPFLWPFGSEPAFEIVRARARN